MSLTRINLLAFAREVLAGYSDGAPGDLDGGVLQDIALGHGLLHAVTVTEPCDPERCICADGGEFPVTCHRLDEDLV